MGIPMVMAFYQADLSDEDILRALAEAEKQGSQISAGHQVFIDLCRDEAERRGLDCTK
jgi:ribosome assembly protein YihI (activator of Der GTPase)